jgi:general secretion pathway protein H
MSRPQGFTLIELLVVLFVLSLVGSVAVFSMDIFKSSQDLENTTQALNSRLRLAQMEAIFDQDVLGVAVDESGYRFFRKTSPSDPWQLISDDSLFKSRSFPNHTELKLTINGKVQPLDQNNPQLILQQGDMTPFSLIFKDGDNHSYEISLNSAGEIVWTPL